MAMKMLITVPKQNWGIVMGLVKLVEQLPEGESVSVSLNEEKAHLLFSEEIDITGFPPEWQRVMTITKFNKSWGAA